jgi:hypothetical protein
MDGADERPAREMQPAPHERSRDERQGRASRHPSTLQQPRADP